MAAGIIPLSSPFLNNEEYPNHFYVLYHLSNGWEQPGEQWERLFNNICLAVEAFVQFTIKMSISIRKIFVQLNEKKTYYTTALGPGRKCVEINFGGILGESFPECVGHSKCPHFMASPPHFVLFLAWDWSGQLTAFSACLLCQQGIGCRNLEYRIGPRSFNLCL